MYEHITPEDREILLSEIYLLLNPATVHASKEDLTRLTSPVEKRKYYAALEVAQIKSSTLPRSISNSVLTSQTGFTPGQKVCSLTRSPAMTKPRHKSESGVAKLSKPRHKSESGIGKMKREKTIDLELFSKVSASALQPKTKASTSLKNLSNNK